MHNKKVSLSKERIVPYFDKWESLMPEIQVRYDSKDDSSAEWMWIAIANYEELLEACSEVSGSTRQTKMEPLNGAERLQFIKDKIISPFALVQLSALYKEMRKKVARFLV